MTDNSAYYMEAERKLREEVKRLKAKNEELEEELGGILDACAENDLFVGKTNGKWYIELPEEDK